MEDEDAVIYHEVKDTQYAHAALQPKMQNYLDGPTAKRCYLSLEYHRKKSLTLCERKKNRLIIYIWVLYPVGNTASSRQKLNDAFSLIICSMTKWSRRINIIQISPKLIDMYEGKSSSRESINCVLLKSDGISIISLWIMDSSHFWSWYRHKIITGKSLYWNNELKNYEKNYKLCQDKTEIASSKCSWRDCKLILWNSVWRVLKKTENYRMM